MLVFLWYVDSSGSALAPENQLMTTVVERNGGIAVQVLDLGNEAARSRYVEDLSSIGDESFFFPF